MDILITFLEGIVTFVSPCLLPMLPLYLAYFAGGSEVKGRAGTRHTLLCACGFVVGFALLFTMMGAFAGAVGGLLVRHRVLIDAVCGAFMILLGLNYMGVLTIPVLQCTWHPSSRVMPRTFASSVLFGMVFAIGWSPCVGTFLASALSMAASSANMLTGVGLLLSYSVGLGLPFVLSALLIDQLEGAFSWVKRHYDAINKVSGMLLVLMGAFMATGMLGNWMRLLLSVS